MNRIYFFLLMIAFVCTASCSDDNTSSTDGGTDVDTECPQGEYSGDFEIATQSDVAFLAGYTSISGELLIECPSCNDLSELICLASVSEDLSIEDNDALTNLDGLSNINSVGGNLFLWDNFILTHLDGLSALTSVGGGLTIDDNAALTHLDGLGGITSVGAELWITRNEALAHLDGLSALTSVGNNLTIFDNYALPDCEACDLLDKLTSGPTLIDVHDNLDDSCTPVPANCLDVIYLVSILK